jgi:hypothetical protein
MGNEFIILDRYLKRNESCCVVSDSGVGKTLFALNVARFSGFKNVLYLDLDDGYGQNTRIEQISCIQPIYLPEFEECIEKVEVLTSNICRKHVVENSMLRLNNQIEEKILRLKKRLGVDNSIRIDELFVLDVFIDEAIQNGTDMIIIDSLNGLVESPMRITRRLIKRISNKCKGKNIPLLLLHHKNKSGIFSGPDSLKQVVDTLLYIEDLGGNYRKIVVDKRRFGVDKEECFYQMIPDGEHLVRCEVCENIGIPSDASLTPTMTKIIGILNDKKTIDFEVLKAELGMSNSNSLRTFLKELEELRYVSRADGKSWKTIINCKYEENAVA